MKVRIYQTHIKVHVCLFFNIIAFGVWAFLDNISHECSCFFSSGVKPSGPSWWPRYQVVQRAKSSFLQIDFCTVLKLTGASGCLEVKKRSRPMVYFENVKYKQLLVVNEVKTCKPHLATFQGFDTCHNEKECHTDDILQSWSNTKSQFVVIGG